MKRPVFTLIAAGVLAWLPVAAGAMTLDGAIAAALANDPGLKRAKADREAAAARVQQARAGGLPSVTLSGSAATGSSDFGPFFGFGRRDMQPRSAQITVQQPIWTSGAVSAAVGQAKAAESGARFQYENVRLGLMADVAAAYEAVLRERQAVTLNAAQVREMSELAAQAEQRFRTGDAPRTDRDQAQARLAQAQAGLAQAQGDLVRRGAHFRALVGEDPTDLAEPGAPPPTPATLAEAIDQARANNPTLAAAQAAVDAGEAGVRLARAQGGPTVALVAEASSVRDQFLPGYRADGATVGVQGRWPLFSGGLVAGKVSEAQASRRGAQAALDQARDAIDEATIDAWQTLRTSEAVTAATAQQTRAADAALYSVSNEVRVGARPARDLLDAEREALTAKLAALDAQAARLVAAYRLNALTGR